MRAEDIACAMSQLLDSRLCLNLTAHLDSPVVSRSLFNIQVGETTNEIGNRGLKCCLLSTIKGLLNLAIGNTFYDSEMPIAGEPGTVWV